MPQILKILRSGSARGISLASYLLDTASLAIVVAYNMRQKFSFSTYGENVFLTIQNIVIMCVIGLVSLSALCITTDQLTLNAACSSLHTRELQAKQARFSAS